MIVETFSQERLDQKCAEGYRHRPESPQVGMLGEEMAQEVWKNEAWEEVNTSDPFVSR